MLEATLWRAPNEEVGVRRAWCVAVLLWGCTAPRERLGDPRAEIGALLAGSAAAWNSGDLAGFMRDYADDSTLTYVSGGQARSDWQALFDRYAAAYFAPGKTRDSLTYDDLQVHPLTPDFAYATARFRLMRGDSVTSSGPFTLILHRRGARWVILHDHTSSDPAQ
jgi:ketosteroid isomerase-like protein